MKTDDPTYKWTKDLNGHSSEKDKWSVSTENMLDAITHQRKADENHLIPAGQLKVQQTMASAGQM